MKSISLQRFTGCAFRWSLSRFVSYSGWFGESSDKNIFVLLPFIKKLITVCGFYRSIVLLDIVVKAFTHPTLNHFTASRYARTRPSQGEDVQEISSIDQIYNLRWTLFHYNFHYLVRKKPFPTLALLNFFVTQAVINWDNYKHKIHHWC